MEQEPPRLRGYKLFDVVSTVLVVGSALTMIGFHVNDRLSRSRLSGSEAPSLVDDWAEANEQGIRLGPANASVVITEFMDFQCPFCAALIPRVDSLAVELGDDVAIVVQHFPLSSHPFAVPAAIAAECAHRQMRFATFYRELFADQKAFGTRTWRSYAEHAGVPDLPRFDRCVELPEDSFPRIAYGRTLGRRTGVRGTPAIWVNGHRIFRTDLDALRVWAKELSTKQ